MKIGICNRYLSIVLPFLAGISYFATLKGIGMENADQLIQVIVAYMVPPLGKESIIPLGVSIGIHPMMLVASIVIVDFLSAMFVYLNYDLLKKNRRIRQLLDKVEKKSQNTIRNKWFGKAWWFGVGLFMIVPFQGSGSISTTVIGRILGVGNKVFFVIIAGSILSSTIIAFTANTITGIFFS